MAKPPDTWKEIERKVAAYLNCKRRGADYGSTTGGKNDLICQDRSVEVKHSARPTWGLITGAIEQAERARERTDDLPLAVIHRKGTNVGDSIVCMRLKDFADWFV